MGTYGSLLSRKKQEQQQELLAATSVDVFRSQPIEIHRRRLKECLQKLLNTSMAVRCGRGEDDDTLELRQTWGTWEDDLEFPWNDLCHQHDRVATDSGSDEESTTALQELVTMLLDPFAIPRAHVAAVVTILFKGLLESPRRCTTSAHRTTNSTSTTTSRWTPSQLLLLQSIKMLWTLCPSLNGIFLHGCVPSLLESPKHATAHQWNRLLSATHYLATDVPCAQSTMLQFLLEMLSRVDTMEQDTVVNITTAKESHRSPPNTVLDDRLIPPPTATSRRLRLATLQDLHDRDISSSTTTTTSYYRPQHLHMSKKGMSGVSLKDVLSSKAHTTHRAVDGQYDRLLSPSATLPPPSSHPNIQGTLSDDWSVVRIRAYKKFHALFRKPPSSLTSLLPPWGTANGPTVSHILGRPCHQFDLHAFLQLIRRNYRSPCLRLCLLLLVSNTSSNPCRVCRMLWMYYVRSKDEMWLRIYSEIVGTWSSLDNRRTCWDAMAPIVMHVGRVMDEMKDPAESNNNDEGKLHHYHRSVFQCLAHILSRRSRLLEMHDDDAILQDFRTLVKRLELYCGEINLWFLPWQQNDYPDTIAAELSTLQRLGILGWTTLTFDDDTGNVATLEEDSSIQDERDPTDDFELQDRALVQWPFSPLYDLRSAYNRLGKDGRRAFNDWDTLLTDADFDTNLEIEVAASQIQTGPPMADYVHHSDLLVQIFRFCAPHDLIRCRNVCQGWKSTLDSSNSLWRDVYQARFPIHELDPRSSSSHWDQEDWNVLFVAKVLNERSLCHRRHHSTGYKHRTCPYIGCTHVLKSQRLEDLHLASHNSSFLRKVKDSTGSAAKKRKEKKKADSDSSEMSTRNKRHLTSGEKDHEKPSQGVAKTGTKKARRA